MNLIIYSQIFIIGTLFGSFSTLAVHRIPLKQSIWFGRSYCPKCESKLQFLDLIPILSYLLLRGKCRYCREPIRNRYFLLEVLSGAAILILAITYKIDIYSNIKTWIEFVVSFFIFIGLFILFGIYKQHKKLQKSVVIYLVIGILIYLIVYLKL